jgi:hypothetical protein
MEYRMLGNTGLRVSRLGAGLSEIGQELALEQTEQAGRVLNIALDNGVNFLDTAACYGNSEEFIGRNVSHRRDEFILATKAGHAGPISSGRDPGADWTYETVVASVDRSLRRLRTDHIDLVQLHSCDVDVLERGDVIRALQDAQAAGKIRFVCYSGDNAAAEWAVESGLFATIQTSYNLVDQRARTRVFPKARENGVGVIIKRPMANSVWGHVEDEPKKTMQWGVLFPRAQAMQALGPVVGAPEDRIALALGFTLASDAVDVALTGTKNPDHMLANLRMFGDGLSLPEETVAELQRRFDQVGGDWEQLE